MGRRYVIYSALLILLTFHVGSPAYGMFQDITEEMFRSSPESNPVQKNYGIAVSDVDNDGHMEVIVAGYNGPNLVLKYDHELNQLVNIAIDDSSSPYYALRDVEGNAIGVSACDVDGDGLEEIYFLNTNNGYSGMATYSDKLFKFRNGRYVDLLSDDINSDIASYFAGRSVACVDRNGNGRYSVYLANYARGSVGPHALIEMDESRSDLSSGKIALQNVAEEAGVEKLTGGRGVTVGPILNKEGYSDIFCDNEHGPNFLFKNDGSGKYVDMSSQTGVSDPYEHGRGVTLTDFNGDEKIDIVYGNWNGPHRIFIQMEDSAGQPMFKNIAPHEFAMPSPIRTVIAADFNNDGHLEILLNNIASRNPAPNKLFTVYRGVRNLDLTVVEQNIGDALEPNGFGTGGSITDLDGDGILEVILAHGESTEDALTIYRLNATEDVSNNGWLRVRVVTPFGAPARGAKVTLHTTGRRHSRVIDAGSGYLCQMEPIAQFGFAQDIPVRLDVLWPDTTLKTVELNATSINTEVIVYYPGPKPQSNRQTWFGSEDCQDGRCAHLHESIVLPRSYEHEEKPVGHQTNFSSDRSFMPELALNGSGFVPVKGRFTSKIVANQASVASVVHESVGPNYSHRESYTSKIDPSMEGRTSHSESTKQQENVISLKEDLNSSVKFLKKSLKSLKGGLKRGSDVETLRAAIRSSIRLLRRSLKANQNALNTSKTF